ncbi:MAG: hypothetical protein JNK87_16585 [Bryobacterales bacterium]|nr:hypothetical protein [Bryobacterales bacterium]
MHAALVIVLLAALGAPAAPLDDARQLYNKAQFDQAIRALQGDTSAAALQLQGQSWFLLGEFKKATDAFDKALEQNANNSELNAWAGRAYGRRAETGNPLAAPRYASKARQFFERAVQLDPRNVEAMNDLFEYYLQAPGFLGGGKDKAVRMAAQIAALDKAEGHFANARMAEENKDYAGAEKSLRLAMEAAPTQVGRVLDLAKFLAQRGRIDESEAEFAKAEKMAPGQPNVLFARASIYAEGKRNLDTARSLLRRYLQSPLTPDDPPRYEAETLLRGL